MCVYLWKPHGEMVDPEILEQCWNYNRDGAGYMWSEKGKVEIRKGYFKFDSFFEAYTNDLPRINSHKSGCAIHFRIGTSGVMDKTNCHPHQITPSLAFVHNGILPIEVPKDSKVSDSIIFAKTFFSALPPNWYKSKNLLSLVELAIQNNKMLILDGQGKHYLLNEEYGEWIGNIYYSNTHWQRKFKNDLEQMIMFGASSETALFDLDDDDEKKDELEWLSERNHD